jgi:hypothetical protein
LFVKSLPAAATNSSPFASVSPIVSRSACETSPPPHELFRIGTPFARAYRIALIASSVVPEPSAPKNFSGMIRELHVTPATPRALLPVAATVPATCVPCPLSSVGLLSPFAKSQPRQSSTYPLPSSSTPFVRHPAQSSPALTQMFGARSGWAVSTPVSMTATTTSELPVETDHASGASMSASGVPAVKFTVWPVLCRPQSRVKKGSFGVTSVA